MPTGQWLDIVPFRLEEVCGPITGKWTSLYDELVKRVAATTPPDGVAVVFEDLQTARRAGAAMIKLFKEAHGPDTIRTAVRTHNQKPSLLVWKGERWGSIEVADAQPS